MFRRSKISRCKVPLFANRDCTSLASKVQDSEDVVVRVSIEDEGVLFLLHESTGLGDLLVLNDPGFPVFEGDLESLPELGDVYRDTLSRVFIVRVLSTLGDDGRTRFLCLDPVVGEGLRSAR